MISKNLVTQRKNNKKQWNDFFKCNRASNVNRTNTNRPPIQLNLANSVNNIRHDPRANIVIYPLKKIQKYNCNKCHIYLFIIFDYSAPSELISKNITSIIQLLKICRHTHITYAFWFQTVRDSFKDLKRLFGDAFFTDISLTMS
jgi:hypothetical protein